MNREKWKNRSNIAQHLKVCKVQKAYFSFTYLFFTNQTKGRNIYIYDQVPWLFLTIGMMSFLEITNKYAELISESLWKTNMQVLSVNHEVWNKFNAACMCKNAGQQRVLETPRGTGRTAGRRSPCYIHSAASSSWPPLCYLSVSHTLVGTEVSRVYPQEQGDNLKESKWEAAESCATCLTADTDGDSSTEMKCHSLAFWRKVQLKQRSWENGEDRRTL